MNTKKIIAAIMVFFISNARAQNNQQVEGGGMNGYLSFSAGVSFPQGDYYSASSRAPGGYAQTGGNFSVGFGITPAHFPLGVAFMGGYYLNRYDFRSYVNNLQASDNSTTYGTNMQNEDMLFYTGFYGMAGLYKEVELGKVALDVRALIGELDVSTPEMNYYATQPASGGLFSSPTTTEWDISSSRGSSFAYGLGIMARIKRIERANIFLSFDYIHAMVPYNTLVFYSDQNGNTSSYNNPTNLNISFISFSLGIGYDLGD